MKLLLQSTRAQRGGIWYRLVLSLAALVLVAVVAFLAGPRNALGPNTATPRPAAPQELMALEGWLQKAEAQYPDIKPGNAKGIVWNSTDHKRTPWAVVYLHGFSGSRLETAPLAEMVGKSLGANVFYTRLTGHGRAGSAMGEASAQDWMADTIEAVQIGQALGERVLVISCSTGSTLATWLATSPQASQVAAHVFVSPNFGPKDKKAELINGPWGKNIALALEGDTRGWTPQNDREAGGWTSRYPTKSLFPMMALVQSVRESDLSGFRTPLLVLYGEQDQTVDPAETKAAFARIGAPAKKLELVTYSKATGQHVLAGDIKDPDATAPMAQSISQWVQALPAQ